MNYLERKAIKEAFQNRTLTREQYTLAMRAVRTAMQPQPVRKYRTIDDSALTLACRLFGSKDGLRVWSEISTMKRRAHRNCK